MMISAAGALLSSTAAEGQTPHIWTDPEQSSTAVLATTDPNLRQLVHSSRSNH